MARKGFYRVDTVFCRSIVTAPRNQDASDFAIGQTATFSKSGTPLFHTDDTRSLAQLGLIPEPRPLAFLLHDMTLRSRNGRPGCL